MDRIQIAEEIRDYISNEANLEDKSIIHESTDLFREGIVDSLMVISIILFCKEKYGCDLTSDEDFENSVRTVRGIATFIENCL